MSPSAVMSYDDAPAEVENFSREPLTVEDFLPEDRLYDFEQWSRCPSLWRHPLQATGWGIRLVFGLASLLAFLSVIAAIPVVNFLAFGYLLAAQGRVARTGKLSYGVPLLGVAPRLGMITIGVTLWLLPVFLVRNAAIDAALIAPGSQVAQNWYAANVIVASVVAFHLLGALARGGTAGCFLRPVKNYRWLWQRVGQGGYFLQAELAVWDFLVALRLREHFWLGLRGFVGTLLWLLVPTVLFLSLRNVEKPTEILITLFGGLLLIPVLTWLPWLQVQFATHGHLSAFLRIQTVREVAKRSPFFWFSGLVLLYTLTLPLFFFKVVVPPRDALWLMTPAFLLLNYPAKLWIAWVYGKSLHQKDNAWLISRIVSKLILIPLLAIYLFLLFLTPAISASGQWVLFEHPALLLPSPF